MRKRKRHKTRFEINHYFFESIYIQFFLVASTEDRFRQKNSLSVWNIIAEFKFGVCFLNFKNGLFTIVTCFRSFREFFCFFFDSSVNLNLRTVPSHSSKVTLKSDKNAKIVRRIGHKGLSWMKRCLKRHEKDRFFWKEFLLDCNLPVKSPKNE